MWFFNKNLRIKIGNIEVEGYGLTSKEISRLIDLALVAKEEGAEYSPSYKDILEKYNDILNQMEAKDDSERTESL